MTYNGWTNYETWLTNLHFNDFTPLFEELTEEGIFDEMNDDDIEDFVTDFIATYIQDYADEGCGENSLFLSDAINAFMQEIDYREIASHYVPDIIADVCIRTKDKEAA